MSTVENLEFIMSKEQILKQCEAAFLGLKLLDRDALVSTINELRAMISEYSPFKDEPVDCVQWISIEAVLANDYNPNTVAPPEMELLERSIAADGYTQPIVAWERDGVYEVVDGFHRNRVARESEAVAARIDGYLPLAIIRVDRQERGDRIASTIRHNRARGKHRIESMSDIVIELRRRNWSPKKIGVELGMDQDEVLRLCQITGLAEMFADDAFSEAWEAEQLNEDDYQALEDD